MDFKKLLIGSIVGGILIFLLDWLIFGNLLMNFMKDNPGTALNVNRGKDDMQFMYLAVGSLSGGALLAYIFEKASVNSLGSGLVTGGVVCFFMNLSIDATMYGWSNVMSKKGMTADILGGVLIGAVVGAVIGLINSKLTKTSA